MPTINRQYNPIRTFDNTLSSALLKARTCRKPDMGETGINYYKAVEEGEWARVQRLRKEEDSLVCGRHALSDMQRFSRRGKHNGLGRKSPYKSRQTIDGATL
jgi:hypothetical protein